MICKYNMIVDFARPQKSNTVIVVENDVDSRQCNFKLLFDKAPFDMTGVVQATVWGVKGDQSQVYSPAEILKDKDGNNINEISWIIPADITEDAGVVTLTVTLADDVGASISSFEFYVKVRNALYNEDDFIDDDDKQGLRDLIARCQAAITYIEEMVAENELPNPYPIRIALDGFTFEYKGGSIVEINMDDVAYLGDAVGLVEVTEDDSAAEVAVEAAESAQANADHVDAVYTEISDIVNEFESKIPTAEVSKEGSVTTITITDQHGTSTAQVYDGDAGTVETEIKDTVGWVGKNELQIPSSVVSKTAEGITYTITRNKQGEVTEIDANGTATADANLVLISNFDLSESNVMSGCPVSGSDSTYRLIAQIGSTYYKDYGSGVELPAGTITSMYCQVKDGQTVDHLKFYPMLRKASVANNTYEPYHETVEEVIEQVYADNGILGAKNLLVIPASVVTKTENGVTFTVTRDSGGQVIEIDVDTGSGTASAGTELTLFNQGTPGIREQLLNKSLILSGGASGNVYLQFRNIDGNDEIVRAKTSEEAFKFTNTSGNFYLAVHVNGGSSASHVKIYPMLRLASDPDDTYVPYAMTNKELTEMLTPSVTASTNLITGASYDGSKNYVTKIGSVVYLDIEATGITASTDDVLFVIPVGYRPKYTQVFTVNGKKISIQQSGAVKAAQSFSNEAARVHLSYIVA